MFFSIVGKSMVRIPDAQFFIEHSGYITVLSTGASTSLFNAQITKRHFLARIYPPEIIQTPLNSL